MSRFCTGLFKRRLKFQLEALPRCETTCSPKRELQPLPERLIHGLLRSQIKLAAIAREIENIDRALAFRIHQSHFNIAPLVGEHRTHVEQQAGAVLSDKVQPACCREQLSPIESHARDDGHLGLLGRLGASPATHQLLQFECSLQNINQVLLEPIALRRVQHQCAVQVHERERVQNRSRGIGEGIRFHDTHAPRGNARR